MNETTINHPLGYTINERGHYSLADIIHYYKGPLIHFSFCHRSFIPQGEWMFQQGIYPTHIYSDRATHY